MTLFLFLSAFLFEAVFGSATMVVLANSPSGDNVPGTASGATVSLTNSPGWNYTNVKEATTNIGINSSPIASSMPPPYAPIQLSSASGSGKADIQFDFLPSSSSPLFSTFVSSNYFWFRAISSTVNPNLHPSFRILVVYTLPSAPMTTFHSLVYEQSYNGINVAATDSWTAGPVSSSTNLWMSGTLTNQCVDATKTVIINCPDGTSTPTSLAQWKTLLPDDTVVAGFNSGIGSGWNGPSTSFFMGAVERLSWTFTSGTTTSDFAVTVNFILLKARS